MLKPAKLRHVIKALENLGFRFIRQKGSHMFFQHDDGRTTVVPAHKEIDIKLLNKIIKDVKMEKEEFAKLL